MMASGVATNIYDDSIKTWKQIMGPCLDLDIILPLIFY